MIPEWQTGSRVLLTLPHENSDWAPILEEAQIQTFRIIEALLNEGKEVVLIIPPEGISNTRTVAKIEQLNTGSNVFPGKLTLVSLPTNDTWTRDYGPILVQDKKTLKYLDFGFNGWGLKFAADKDNLINRELNVQSLFPDNSYRNESAFILEGGSVDSDGKGTILTTTRCLCSPNRNGGLTKKEAEEAIRHYLNASHVLMLDYGALEGDDTDSHIDTLARMAPDDSILFVGCRDENDPHFEELLKMRAQLMTFRTIEGTPYNLIELPLPEAIYDEEGQRLPATYANYLVTEDVILMPTYNQPSKDKLAMMTLGIAFPEHRIVGVDCRVLIRQHGSLHCATCAI